MKNKILLIAAVVLTIAASIALMIWQRQQKKEEAPVSEPTPVVSQSPVAAPTSSSLPEETPEPAPELTETASTPSSPRPVSGPAFSVYINGKTVSIAYGVDEKTLDKGPGWLETSSLPGQDGMCVIYGHRNNAHLRILETVEAGDSVTVTMPDGTKHIYIITQVQAFEQTADLTIPTLDGKSIALVTCYPFRYSGSAPGKYLVVGQIDAEATD